MRDARELLRAANPVPECPAPPIDRLWARLALDTPTSVEATPRRWAGASAWVGRFVVGAAVAAAIAIGIGAVVVLHAHTRASAPPAARIQTRPSPKRELTGILAVLRRPQTAADLGRELPLQLGSRSSLALAGTRVRSLIRLAALAGTPVRSLIRLATVTPWGERVFLVPTRPVTPAAAAKLLAAAKVPPAVRRGLVDRLERQGRGLTLGINGPGGMTVAQIRAGDVWESSGPSPSTLIVVVPDGVARVTVQLPHLISAIVHNNVAAFESPQLIENLSVDKMTWYSPAGTIVNRPKATNAAFGVM